MSKVSDALGALDERISQSKFAPINLLECMKNATLNIIEATFLALQALQIRLKQYLLYKDPVFTLATPFGCLKPPTPC